MFFSPSGVQFALPLLQVHCKNADLKVLDIINCWTFCVNILYIYIVIIICMCTPQVAAIGPATAAALKDAGLFSIIAHKPTPEALLDIIQ